MDAKEGVFNYTAASGVIPVKLFLDRELTDSIIGNRKIIPVHVQLNPTNRCNQRCAWCSCSNRDTAKELSFDDTVDIMTRFKKLGCKSVTITGGGEPLLHPKINDIIEYIHEKLRIKTGLVTNGIRAGDLSRNNWNRLTWVRFSLGDGNDRGDGYWRNIKDITGQAKTDFSFSYVVTKAFNLDAIVNMIRFANECDFTHIRITTDILSGDAGTLMETLKQRVHDLVDDGRVIYQDRGRWTKGRKQCYISLLKPVVSADGRLFPCCGSQYMLENPSRDYTGEMGGVDRIEEIIENQRYYDGSGCYRCFYEHYNYYLALLLNGIAHKEFV
ncbi:MAG: radical SAM protein [Spirochaetales bacterium]|nr:radical SAM protein [Spirochaetales bacterium]